MAKNKPRHNPDKPQNKMGSFCSYYEEGHTYCEALRDTTKCGGNPHNCIKVTYQINASMGDKRKNNEIYNKRNEK